MRNNRSALVQAPWRGPILKWALSLALLVTGCAPAQWARQALAAPLDRSRLVLSFEDHFAHGPDPRIWADPEAPDSVAGRSIKENQELELYVDPQMRGTGPAALNLNALTASDQGLEISASRIPAEALPYTWGYTYMSGRLNSRRSLAQTYGYFEARVKVPSGAGLWPAFWMLPARGGWPPEIDIFEVLGRDPSVVYHSIHTGVWSKPNHFTRKYQTDDLSKDYHTYGVWWDRTTIRFYLDDRFVTQYDTPPQLNQPCYLILNLAVGGWGGAPDPRADQLGVMKVAWVKAYHFAD